MTDNMRNDPIHEPGRSTGRAGEFAGHRAGMDIDPTLEDSYWRENFSSRPYVRSGSSWDDYRDAYRYGWESRLNRADGRFDDAAQDLERGWDKARSKSRLAWSEAKEAVRDAWHRVEKALPGDADKDGR